MRIAGLPASRCAQRNPARSGWVRFPARGGVVVETNKTAILTAGGSALILVAALLFLLWFGRLA